MRNMPKNKDKNNNCLNNSMTHIIIICIMLNNLNNHEIFICYIKLIKFKINT